MGGAAVRWVVVKKQSYGYPVRLCQRIMLHLQPHTSSHDSGSLALFIFLHLHQSDAPAKSTKPPINQYKHGGRCIARGSHRPSALAVRQHGSCCHEGERRVGRVRTAEDPEAPVALTA